MTYTPLSPPLYEAPVSEWIRKGLLRKSGAELITFEEIVQAGQNRMTPSFLDWVTFWLEPNEEDTKKLTKFNDLRRARYMQGYLRYNQFTGINPAYDKVAGIKFHLNGYQEDGNLEHLVDVVNLCDLEYCWPHQEGARLLGKPTNIFTLSDALDYITVYTHQLDYLVGIAVCCYAEYFDPIHPKAHFQSIDDGSHVQET